MVAPLVLDGPIRGEAVEAYVNPILTPDLKPCDIIIHNPGGHKLPGIRQAIKGLGATLLYLPPDSPDFNPGEKRPSPN